jgi:DNA anti-recombination protein RmuC
MGMRGMQIEENANRLYASLSGMQKQVDTFAEVFGKLGTHLKNAQQSYNESEKRLDKAQTTLEGLVGGQHHEPTLENAQGTLLPLETATKKNA